MYEQRIHNLAQQMQVAHSYVDPENNDMVQQCKKYGIKV